MLKIALKRRELEIKFYHLYKVLKLRYLHKCHFFNAIRRYTSFKKIKVLQGMAALVVGLVPVGTGVFLILRLYITFIRIKSVFAIMVRHYRNEEGKSPGY